MANKKFSQFTAGGTNQVPTDVVVGLDLSLSTANQNTQWTLNNLFSTITRNITDGALRFGGFAAPSLSGAGTGALYFDSSANVFKVSSNGGAFVTLGDISGTFGATGQVAVANGTKSVTGSNGLTYAAGALTVGESGTAGGVRLVANSGNYWNIASSTPAGNRTFYFPDSITPTTGNFLFVGTFGATVVTDWSTGLTWSNSSKQITVTASANAPIGLGVQNTSAGTLAECQVGFTANGGAISLLSLTGTGFTTSGLYKANQLYWRGTTGITEMLFALDDASTAFKFGVNNAVAASINATSTEGLVLGIASTLTGRVKLYNSAGATYTQISAGNAASSLNYILPATSPTAGQVLTAAAPSGGNVVLSWGAGGGGGAPADATYLTLSLNGTLTNERVFTLADTTLSEVDGGAGGNYTLGVNQANAFAWTAAHTWQQGTSQANALSILKASIGSAGQRDSDRLLFQAKANDGTDYAIEARQYINVVSNDGVGSLFTIDGRNTFAGAGFNTLFTLNISSGDIVTPGTLTSGTASAATGALNLYNSGSANVTALQAGAAAAALTYVLPATSPTLGQVMQANAPSGGVSVLSWAEKSATSNGLYRLSGYNLDRGLKKWRAAMANAPQAAASVVVIGDSITCGTGASSYAVSYQQQLQTLLQNRFGAGSSFTGYYGETSSGGGFANPNFVKTSGAWPDAAQGGLTGRAFSSSSSGDALTISNVYGTAVEIYTVNNPNTTGSFSVQIDGGAAQVITQSTTASLATAQVVRNVISMGSLGNHTVRINGPAAGSLYVTGLAGRIGSTGIRYYPFGLTGSRSNDWSSSVDNRAQGIAAFAPNLFVIAVNTNDFTFQTPLVTFQANIERLIVAAQAVNSDVLILVENPNGVGVGPIPQSDYRDVLLGLADTYDCALVDILARWESLAYQAAQGLSTDTVHPTDLGHSDYFRALLDACVTGDMSQTANAAQVFSGAVRTTSYGFDNVRLGTYSGTSAIIFEDSGNQWSIDPAGGLRFVYNFSSVPFALDTSGNLTISGNVVASGSGNTKFNTAGGNFGVGISGTPTGLMVGTSVNTTAQGVSNARMGLNGSAPSLVLETTAGGGSSWALDNASGVLRFVLNNASVPFVFNSNGNFGVGTSTFGTSAAKVVAISSGTAPTSYPADAIQLMSADYAAGDSRLRIYSENGAQPVVIGGNAILSGRQVIAKTADYTIQYADSNTVFTNTGASGAVIFTLCPTGVIENYTLQFFRVANQSFTIQCPPGVIIRVGASATSAGGTVTLDAVGSGLWIIQVDSSVWYGYTVGAVTFA